MRDRVRCWIARHIGNRGAFLLFLAMLDVVYAIGLAFPTPRARASDTYMFLDEAGSLVMWALLWTGVGVTCAVFAFRKADTPGFMAAMFIKVLWAAVFLLGWIFAGVERGYLSTAIWGVFAGVVWIIAGWPEPKGRK